MLDNLILNFYDFRQLTLPEQMLSMKIDPAVIDQGILEAAERFLLIEAVTTEILPGDIVALERMDCEKTLRLNVGTGFFDENLEKALLGKKAGDICPLPIKGETVSIRIESVKRRMIPILTDDLVCKLEVDGVRDVEAYRKYLFEAAVEKEKRRRSNGLCSYVSKQLQEKTTFASISSNDPALTAFLDSYRAMVQIFIQRDGCTEEAAIVRGFRLAEGKTLEEYWQLLRQRAETIVKLAAIGKIYAEEDGVVYTEDAMLKEYQQYADQDGVTLEQILQGATIPALVVNAYQDYLYQKIDDHFGKQYCVTLG